MSGPSKRTATPRERDRFGINAWRESGRRPRSKGGELTPLAAETVRVKRYEAFQDIGKRRVSASELIRAGGNRDNADDTADSIEALEKESGWAEGLHAETDFELSRRLMASMYQTGEKGELSQREGEAVGLYLWGRLRDRMLGHSDRDEEEVMIFAILAEHPPWSKLSDMMSLTKRGTFASEGDVRRYLRSAARKLGVSVPGLRDLAIKGLTNRLSNRLDKAARARR